MSDRKEQLAAAIDAVTRAAEACTTAGVSVVAGWGIRSGDDLCSLLRERAEAALSLAIAADRPIVIGDVVRVVNRYGERTCPLVAVGRAWITVGRTRYEISSGDERSPSNSHIHPHDLARIRRWLVKGGAEKQG